jgi:8-oxo-dGTP pyrophosphatase MutT (NUDIX family)
MLIDFQLLKNKLTEPLPGAQAHEPLRAVPTGLIKPNFKHPLPPRPGSVLILLYEEDGLTKFPLTKRPEYPGTHGGQISLPGGKAEPGESLIETALREAEEEIGIARNRVEVIGTLSDFFVIPSNFMVTPVVAYLPQVPQFQADPKEVMKIIHGNVEALLQPDAVKQKEIMAARLFPMMAPHFVPPP